MNPDDQNIDDSILRIREGAKLVRQSGDAVTNRIRMFEAWLNKLPGKVSTCIALPSNGEISTNLSFYKKGGEWVLGLHEEDCRDLGEQTDVRLLRDASLDDKLYAVTYFSTLLAKFADTQRKVSDQATAASGKLEDFFKKIDLKEGV